MRIVSYNILDGGEGRADPLAEVIIAQRPDVVCLVEAEDQAVVQRIAQRMDMDFIHAPGNTHASALLSRYPISQTINHAALNKVLEKSFLEAIVIDDAAAEWPIGVVHLHAHASLEDEAQREVELSYVLQSFAKYREAGRAHILAGDFNSNAPSQQIDPDRCAEHTRKDWKKNGGMLPRRVVQAMLAYHYEDTFAELHPAEAKTAGSFTTQFPGQRVDYIFTYGVQQSQLIDSWIETDRLAKYASDHFPIGLEIATE